jgi:hypothetical protein
MQRLSIKTNRKENGKTGGDILTTLIPKRELGNEYNLKREQANGLSKPAAVAS